MTVFDAHIHLIKCKYPLKSAISSGYAAMDCSLTPDEFYKQSELIKQFESDFPGSKIYKSYGVHPWFVQEGDIGINFLKKLLDENLIDAVGECGLDFYTPELKACKEVQLKYFLEQLGLAANYKKVVVIHGRKCIADFISLKDSLKKLPLVIFHGWSGTCNEALKLLDFGVNCYFSFGKELLRGRVKSVECVLKLPSDRIFSETDGPYMTLKNESETIPEDIFRVQDYIKKIRPEAGLSIPDGFI